MKWTPSRSLGNFLVYKQIPTTKSLDELLSKKTISCKLGENIYHLVAYYSATDLEFDR